MRPDPHKAKESRKYQSRQKKIGNTEAVEVAEARKKASKARDKGLAKFSRRQLASNADRYIEETEQVLDVLERDAELGIDRETTDLVSMLESTEEGSSSFFKFKEEQYDTTTAAMNKNMMELNFTLFEPTLENFDATQLLGLKQNDKDLSENIFNEHPTVLDKPIVPSFSKSAKGYVLFKSQQPVKPNVISEENGIYIRNDRHIPNITTPKPKTEVINDDLDELLALDSAPKVQPKKNVLPKPGSIIKKKAEEIVVDDEAWLDDLLG
ncbi:hypothetical protein INT48_005141 [Thamnidium elegans]|uniref:Uncharacterized protein n=1 Tax=Thamnidium elegans TaxID=101142 RepID=A0A8H7VR08_9FUNG|nr:hypothetical protein INT48_005141 [Thamnidium elegans]